MRQAPETRRKGVLSVKIIYESGAGHTERYAKLLAEKLGLECLSLKEADKSESESVIFCGWVCANKISGLKKASGRFNVAAVCAVGLYPKTDAVTRVLIDKNKLGCPLFYLRGGLDYTKISKLRKKLLLVIRDTLKRENKPDSAELIEVLTNGGDFFDEDYLSEPIAFGLLRGETSDKQL